MKRHRDQETSSVEEARARLRAAAARLTLSRQMGANPFRLLGIAAAAGWCLAYWPGLRRNLLQTASRALLRSMDHRNT